MANNIALFKQSVPLLDEVYKNASLSSVLDGNAELAREGANANELIIPKISMDGLGNYDRNGGYVNGDVSMTYETVACNYDRGRMFSVDALDDAETAGIAYGRLASEFERTKVAPELDAFRFAKYATEAPNRFAGGINNGESAVYSIREAYTRMSEAEVPTTGRYLFITPTIKGMIDDLDSTKSRAVLEGFEAVIEVPQTRFYSAIQMLDGKTTGQELGGYVKAPVAQDINFLIIHKDAVIQYQKHVAPKVVTPEQNQTGDAWKFGYRTVGIADVYENKADGIVVHLAPAE